MALNQLSVFVDNTPGALSDIAEGLGTIIEALKLVSNGLDDVANLMRDSVTSEG